MTGLRMIEVGSLKRANEPGRVIDHERLSARTDVVNTYTNTPSSAQASSGGR